MEPLALRDADKNSTNIISCAKTPLKNSAYIDNTHARALNGPFSGTRLTRVSRYLKGKTNLDFTEARDSEWQWHQLGRMQVCTSLQTDNHASTPPLRFFTGRVPFLPPNQQRQSIECLPTSTSTEYKYTYTSQRLVWSCRLQLLHADRM